MSAATDGPTPTRRIVVCVQHHPGGRWEVLPPGGRGRISCETLDDARRLAYLSVAHANDCELIVRDAHNRVLEHDLIEGHRGPTTGSQSPPKHSTTPGGR